MNETTLRRRVRLRFRKEGDLRLISHRDLMRVFERLFRRAGLQLSLSQGFHPKPRMTFPLALAVGMTGCDEIMELELAEECSADALVARLAPQCPRGLVFTSAEVLPPGTRKAQVVRFVCELPLAEFDPQAASSADWSARVAALLAESTHLVDRGAGHRSQDLRSYVETLAWDEGVLRMQIRVTPEGTARPREVLEALGVPDPDRASFALRRTRVELAP